MHSYRSTPELSLNSGDFEAVSPYPSIPAPPRAPVFARSAGPAFSWDPRNDRRAMAAPPPPGSLAPVAMGQMTANATGTVRAQIVDPEPASSTKWGLVIAVVGVVLGGGLGILLNANAATAAAAASQGAPEAAQVAMQAPAQQAMAAPQAQMPAAPQPAMAVPVPLQPQPIAQASQPVMSTKDVDKGDSKKAGAHHAAATRHHAAAPAAPVAHATPVTRTKPVLAASVPARDAEEKPAPVTRRTTEKPEKAEKPEKPAKAAETNAAVDLLKQANKETSLSLGGSK